MDFTLHIFAKFNKLKTWHVMMRILVGTKIGKGIIQKKFISLSELILVCYKHTLSENQPELGKSANS